ncbi:MAG: hypothetical protein H6953_10535 [Chromatiaceae bacterium]|nr:hypothetical protein [Gammaproteobacteria bacterium]MCP5305876.1 hypothetical protein [Chromatiaceae bacterium]MCP5312732.1 hypothetical protein [Chromatiaceae bacterium]
MSRFAKAGLLALLWLLTTVAAAENMLMGRIPMRAEIVLEYVKTSVEEHGYSVAHIQLCDGGMADFGYKSDFYRVVFFGKVDEVRKISERYPELVSYVPLKIAVIAEKDETLLAVLNPRALSPFYADEEVQIQLDRWHSDLISILDDIRRATGKRLAAG